MLWANIILFLLTAAIDETEAASVNRPKGNSSFISAAVL
jgi:hypothetical protein